jgi:hypothetical protein
MFDSDTPKIISRLYDVIAAVESALTERFTVQPHQCQGERALFFANADGKRFFYFGVWYELWSRSSFPLWYGVHSQWSPATVQTFLKQHPEAIGFEGYHLCRAECAPVFDDGQVEPVIELITQELDSLMHS